MLIFIINLIIVVMLKLVFIAVDLITQHYPTDNQQDKRTYEDVNKHIMGRIFPQESHTEHIIQHVNYH